MIDQPPTICPHCLRRVTDLPLFLHVRCCSARHVGAEPRPTPLTAKYQARLEGAMLFSAAGQKAGQKAGQR